MTGKGSFVERKSPGLGPQSMRQQEGLPKKEFLRRNSGVQTANNFGRKKSPGLKEQVKAKIEPVLSATKRKQGSKNFGMTSTSVPCAVKKTKPTMQVGQSFGENGLVNAQPN